MTDVLVVSDLAKSFPGTRALGGVSLTVRAGEVHALLGGNGCGKSTFIKAIAGVQPADAGTIRAGGLERPAPRWSAALARQAQLHVVHQQSSGFGNLTVAENLAAGRGFERRGPLRTIAWRAQRRRARDVLERFALDVDPDVELMRLRPAAQRMIAIARALQGAEEERPGLVVLDEPTAALPGAEAKLLLESLRSLIAGGWAILYVTHLLDELANFADRATVLRDGRVAGVLAEDEITHARLLGLMTGRAQLVHDAVVRPSAAPREVALQVTHLRGGPLRDVTLEAGSGEIVGIAGLIGSGRSSLLQALFGATTPESGELTLDGRPLPRGSVADAIEQGVAYVAEDRAKESSFAGMSVAENLSAAHVGERRRGPALDLAGERRAACDAIARYGIRCNGPSARFGSLSGGNQQKLIVARWLTRMPRLLLLDEPTQGVDVAARAEIHVLVREAAAAGTTVLVASSDPDELVALCDRVLVLRRGTVTDELTGSRCTAAEIERAAYDLEVAS